MLSKLKDVDELQLDASRLKVVAVEARGLWLDLQPWADAGSEPYHRIRVQVELACGPTPLTAKQVLSLVRGAQQMRDNFGAVLPRR